MNYCGLTGSWREAGITLQNLAKNINKSAEKELKESGELVKDIIVKHIDNQDLGWKPLSPITVRIKGSDTIYVDTGLLRSNITVRGVKSKVNKSTIFIGGNPWTRHLSGLKMSELMNFMEYGTKYMPPRPLIRPSFNEAKPLVINKFTRGVVGDIRKAVIK